MRPRASACWTSWTSCTRLTDNASTPCTAMSSMVVPVLPRCRTSCRHSAAISRSLAARRSSSCWTTRRVWMVCPSPTCSSSCWKITAPSWCAPPALSQSSRPISLSVQRTRKPPRRWKQKFVRVLKNS